MPSAFDIEFEWEACEYGSTEERATSGTLTLRSDNDLITYVEDLRARTTRERIRVSAYPLAVWFASNWWRLRWEPERQSTDWAMSHKLPAVGHGYVWPPLSVHSEGDTIVLQSQRTRSASAQRDAPTEPVRFLNDVHSRISAREFTDAIARFVDSVVARLKLLDVDADDLSQLWSIVQSERRDPDTAYVRRLEALMGFDPEEAPVERLVEMVRAGARVGKEAVAELAIERHENIDWKALEREIRKVKPATIQNYGELRVAVHNAARGALPWQRGESAAIAVREQLQRERGPVSDGDLVDWFGEPSTMKEPTMAAAWRDEEVTNSVRFALRSRFESGRRFEHLRLLADHLLAASREDLLLPATSGLTSRQKFQRAFAAEFLLPSADLMEIFTDSPDDDDAIQETAEEFGVSPVLVTSRLVNKRLASRDLLF